jgi:hypothetical protein
LTADSLINLLYSLELRATKLKVSIELSYQQHKFILRA